MAFSQASVFGRRICTESKNLKIQLAIVDLVSNRIAAPFEKKIRIFAFEISQRSRDNCYAGSYDCSPSTERVL